MRQYEMLRGSYVERVTENPDGIKVPLFSLHERIPGIAGRRHYSAHRTGRRQAVGIIE